MANKNLQNLIREYYQESNDITAHQLALACAREFGYEKLSKRQKQEIQNLKFRNALQKFVRNRFDHIPYNYGLCMIRQQDIEDFGQDTVESPRYEPIGPDIGFWTPSSRSDEQYLVENFGGQPQPEEPESEDFYEEHDDPEIALAAYEIALDQYNAAYDLWANSAEGRVEQYGWQPLIFNEEPIGFWVKEVGEELLMGTLGMPGEEAFLNLYNAMGLEWHL